MAQIKRCITEILYTFSLLPVYSLESTVHSLLDTVQNPVLSFVGQLYACVLFDYWCGIAGKVLFRKLG